LAEIVINPALEMIVEVISQDLVEIVINRVSEMIVGVTSQDLAEIVINPALEMTVEVTSQGLVERAGVHFREILTVDHQVLRDIPVEIKVEIQGFQATEVVVSQKI
jgi:hypothetical protein